MKSLLECTERFKTVRSGPFNLLKWVRRVADVVILGRLYQCVAICLKQVERSERASHPSTRSLNGLKIFGMVNTSQPGDYLPNCEPKDIRMHMAFFDIDRSSKASFRIKKGDEVLRR